MKNLIEQLGLTKAKQILERAPDETATHYFDGNYFREEQYPRVRHYHRHTGECVQGCDEAGWVPYTNGSTHGKYSLKELRTQLAEYEAGLAPDSDYVNPNPVLATLDQRIHEALNRILERVPDPSADFYVADTDTYFSLETGTYFNHAHKKWLESKYRTEQELREKYESVFNLLDVVEQVVALEPQAQDVEKLETSIPYTELKKQLEIQNQKVTALHNTALLFEMRIEAVHALATEWAAADANNDKARTLNGCAKRIHKALGEGQ